MHKKSMQKIDTEGENRLPVSIFFSQSFSAANFSKYGANSSFSYAYDLRIFLLRENALPFLFRVLAEFCEQPVPVLEEAVVGAV